MGKGAGCTGSKFSGGGSGTPHEKLETGPSSDAKVPENNDAPAPAASAGPAVTPAAPAVTNSTPAPVVEKSADDDTPVKTEEAAAATPVTSTKVKVFIM